MRSPCVVQRVKMDVDTHSYITSRTTKHSHECAQMYSLSLKWQYSTNDPFIMQWTNFVNHTSRSFAEQRNSNKIGKRRDARGDRESSTFGRNLLPIGNAWIHLKLFSFFWSMNYVQRNKCKSSKQSSSLYSYEFNRKFCNFSQTFYYSISNVLNVWIFFCDFQFCGVQYAQHMHNVHN